MCLDLRADTAGCDLRQPKTQGGEAAVRVNAGGSTKASRTKAQDGDSSNRPPSARTQAKGARDGGAKPSGPGAEAQIKLPADLDGQLFAAFGDKLSAPLDEWLKPANDRGSSGKPQKIDRVDAVDASERAAPARDEPTAVEEERSSRKGKGLSAENLLEYERNGHAKLQGVLTCFLSHPLFLSGVWTRRVCRKIPSRMFRFPSLQIFRHAGSKKEPPCQKMFPPQSWRFAKSSGLGGSPKIPGGSGVLIHYSGHGEKWTGRTPPPHTLPAAQPAPGTRVRESAHGRAG
jgi:hypothetical protein